MTFLPRSVAVFRGKCCFPMNFRYLEDVFCELLEVLLLYTSWKSKLANDSFARHRSQTNTKYECKSSWLHALTHATLRCTIGTQPIITGQRIKLLCQSADDTDQTITNLIQPRNINLKHSWFLLVFELRTPFYGIDGINLATL